MSKNVETNVFISNSDFEKIRNLIDGYKRDNKHLREQIKFLKDKIAKNPNKKIVLRETILN